MTKIKEVETSWKRQQELVNAEPVWENIDRLACALTGNEKEARTPGKEIFVKPPGKTWSDTVVAIKNQQQSPGSTRAARSWPRFVIPWWTCWG